MWKMLRVFFVFVDWDVDLYSTLPLVILSALGVTVQRVVQWCRHWDPYVAWPCNAPFSLAPLCFVL